MIDEMDAKQPLLENTSFFKMYRDEKISQSNHWFRFSGKS